MLNTKVCLRFGLTSHTLERCNSGSFLLVEDQLAGKKVYMTASTAKEHINSLWEKEGMSSLIHGHLCDCQFPNI